MELMSLGRPWYGLLLSVGLMAEMLKEHALAVLWRWFGHTHDHRWLRAESLGELLWL